MVSRGTYELSSDMDGHECLARYFVVETSE